MAEQGTVCVNATLTFKGKVDVTLWDGMTMAEVIHDIIHCGDYEYEVVSGDMQVDAIEY